MRKFSLFLFPVFLILSSCFSTRTSKTDSKILVVDPVKLTLDTIDLVYQDGMFQDSTLKYTTMIDSADTDTIAVAMEESVEINRDSLIENVDQELLANVDTIELIEAIPPIDTITIIGTGDIMPGTNFPDNRYLPPGNNAAACCKRFN